MNMISDSLFPLTLILISAELCNRIEYSEILTHGELWNRIEHFEILTRGELWGLSASVGG